MSGGVALVASALLLVPAPSGASAYENAFSAMVRSAHRAGAQRSRSRRPATAAICETSDPLSFVGISDQDDVAGNASSVPGGAYNRACAKFSAIADGFENTISSAGDGKDAAGSFIGAGGGNSISGVAAFIGAGGNNESDGSSAFVGAGTYNLSTASDSFVGGGIANAARGNGAIVGAGDEVYAATFFGGNVPPIGNLASGEDSFVGAGDLNQVTGQGSFVGAGGSSYAATGAHAVANGISGTDSFIGAGDENNVTGSWSFVGSGELNFVAGPGSFIGAGGTISAKMAGVSSFLSGTDSFIGAGDVNEIAANEAFIGAGQNNTIAARATYAALAGGSTNSISGEYGAIAGGIGGNAAGTGASIGGGEANLATGTVATIPGGYHNVAGGIASFAAGYGAEALTNGAFVWADDAAPATRVKSTLANEFLARASGGFYLYTNAASTSGVRLAAGSGAWSSLSDRNMKTDVTPLDDAAVLDKIAALPVSVWSYRSERGVRHVGPMAQDFYAAFKVGEDDRHITSIDEDGVALAAIKALDAKVARKDAAIAALQRRDASLQSQLTALAARVDALQKR